MKLKKAIKVGADYIGTGPEAEPVEFDEACRLLVEAGKRVQNNRRLSPTGTVNLLPGETKD